MSVGGRSTLLERRLRAEVRRILRLLERTRRTRDLARLLIEANGGVSPHRRQQYHPRGDRRRS